MSPWANNVTSVTQYSFMIKIGNRVILIVK
jgi:hypothetical protein